MLSTINKLSEEAWEARNNPSVDLTKLAEDIADLALTHDYELGLAQSLVIQGYKTLQHSEFKDGLIKLQKALALFETHTNQLWLLRSLNTLGILYGQTGDFKSAHKAFLQVQKIAQELDLKKAEADALANLAIIYLHFGDFHLALEHNLESLDLYQKLNAKQNQVKTLQNIGVIYYDSERYREALAQFEQAETLLKENPEERTLALVCSNLGRTHHKLGNDLAANSYQQLSLELFNKLEDKSGISYVLDEMGRRQLDNANYDQAELKLQKSLALKCELGDQKGEIDSSLHLGELYRLQHRYSEALAILTHALTLAEKLEAKKEQGDAHYNLAYIYKEQAKLGEAFNHLETHMTIKDDIFSLSSDQRFQALRVRHEVEQTEKEKEIYRLKNVELVKLNEQLQSLTEKLEKQAIEDPLTKLYNRRHFEKVLTEAYNRSFRYGNALSVMICDIDNFKKVNDTFSHAVGDEVLIQVATIFKTNLREVDTLARYGGEEFVALFPETTSDDAALCCDRFRVLIEDFPWHSIHPDLKVTISMGVCEDISSGSGEAMISKADEALYEVKRNGKNHVRIWQETNSVIWTP